VTPVAQEVLSAPDELADAAQDDETLSVAERWKTIATHGRETGREAYLITTALASGLADLFDLAGRWHDAGKVHPAFAGSIVGQERPDRQDLAKAPEGAWLKGKKLYPMPDGSHRPGFRHELASVLALFGVLQRHAPDHPALLGPWRELLEKAGCSSPRPRGEGLGVKEPTALENEILALVARRQGRSGGWRRRATYPRCARRRHPPATHFIHRRRRFARIAGQPSRPRSSCGGLEPAHRPKLDRPCVGAGDKVWPIHFGMVGSSVTRR